ncbi:phytanoyl-CoA dioxygenase family protein [Pirellulales bacterium]|nr:phytanoyl-CoA dioxygenase family protein [Pirellulales bacterium]
MLDAPDYLDRIRRNGFAIAEDVVGLDRIDKIRDAIRGLREGDEVRRKTNVYGIRNLLEVCAATRELAGSSEIRKVVVPVLGPGCFAVRATFFDKVPDANWKLRYHQDSVIAVKERHETPGFTAWSNKAGVLQVRPPEEILADMLAIRVHLDDSTRQDGPLRVLARSHQKRWPREVIPKCRADFQEVTCEVSQGGVLAMRPLVLHASSASEIPEHRRVIHIEYACKDLPSGLEWQTRIPATTTSGDSLLPVG